MKKLLIFFIITTFLGAANAQDKEITLEKALSGFRPQYVTGITPMKNQNSYSVLENNCIVKYSYQTGLAEETIVNFSRNCNINYVVDYELSKDETKILFYTDYNPIYRNSFSAEYYIYDTITKNCSQLTDSEVELATINPDSKNVAFVYQNNIYLKDLETEKITAITTDGQINKIINGRPDWVYEEEFGFTKAFEFSPDGKKIAYIKFDESNVESFDIQYYSSLHPLKYNSYQAYPYIYTYKYPKAGQNNSIVSVNIYDIETKQTQTADIGTETDIYIPRICWTQDPEKLCIARMNRLQNKLELIEYNTKTKNSKVFYTQTEEKYIEDDIVKSLTFLPDGKTFIILSEQDGYRNIYLHSIDGKQINAVTSGSPEVIKINGYDSENKTVFFTGVGKNEWQTSIYKVELSEKKRTNLSTRQGTNEAEFGTNCKYFINFFSNATTPYIITVNRSTDGQGIRRLQSNFDLKEKTDEYGGAHKDFFTFPTSSGIKLNAWIIKPNNFDSTKKYPVLTVGYNGPNYNMVTDEWEFGWHQMLAQKGIIVACCDTRGTGRRGNNFRKGTYEQLGNLETQDLADFAKYLAQQNFIDGNRIGIWGWSYGGFMAANAMMRTPGIFKLGIAVAPVTNWLLYDNIYTERYMNLPQNNYLNYNYNSPLKYASNLEGKFLLITGSADDNVHPQNSLLLNEALVQADKDFDFMQYTNKNHGIYGGNTRLHLYKKMTEFILNNL